MSSPDPSLQEESSQASLVCCVHRLVTQSHGALVCLPARGLPDCVCTAVTPFVAFCTHT